VKEMKTLKMQKEYKSEVLTMFIGDEKNKNKNRSNREGTN